MRGNPDSARGPPDGNWHDGLGAGTGSWFLMVIMMVALFAGLIWIGITMLRHNHSAPQVTPTSAQRPSAPEILAERLARGEIDTDDDPTLL